LCDDNLEAKPELVGAGPGREAQPADRAGHGHQHSGAGCRRHPVSTEDEHRCRGADTRTDRELAGRHDGDQDRDGVRERGIHADHVQQQPVAKDLAEDGKQDERA
jgi:hypothetical protein